MTNSTKTFTSQSGPKKIPNVKRVIAIASGKGGVGKSTTTSNIALALAAKGLRVGILDADIYGPNQPHMLGIKEKPVVTADKKFQPIESHGIQSMSIGYLVDMNTPTIWRGPMVSGALQQLLRDTLWENLDYLLIDLPPGTGDIQLTLVKKVPVDGAIIITTPQDIALLDARKGLEMFKRVDVPVLGIVENMSIHMCSACGHEEAIFGSKGAEKMAQECEVPLLGRLPLALAIRTCADNGKPLVISEPDSKIAQEYCAIARKILAQVSTLAKKTKFPEIVVE